MGQTDIHKTLLLCLSDKVPRSSLPRGLVCGGPKTAGFALWGLACAGCVGLLRGARGALVATSEFVANPLSTSTCRCLMFVCGIDGLGGCVFGHWQGRLFLCKIRSKPTSDCSRVPPHGVP